MTKSSDPAAMLTGHAARSICRQFQIDGEFAGFEPFERGHIHDTFVSSWRHADGTTCRYLHQRINHDVFHDVGGLMHNIEAISTHLCAKLGPPPTRCAFQALRLVRTDAGGAYLRDEAGWDWRTYEFLEETIAFDVCESPDRAFEAASVFGRFQSLLADIDVRNLRETIPEFFSPGARLRQLRKVLADDPVGRLASAQPEIAFALERAAMIEAVERRIRDRTLKQRVVHGDTKLNNVLFHEHTGKAVAVVDLDTCMPGWSLYDFGDLVRFTAARTLEDETDLDRVGTDLVLYRALVDGYLEHAAAFLSRHERELMPLAARVVTLTIGLRFLTDYLAGDHYFKTTRDLHNLDRCRVQFGMVADMERQRLAMEQGVRG